VLSWQRWGLAGAIFAVAAAGISWFFVWALSFPPSIAAASTSSGSANLTLQTVGAIGFGPHPTWVSYLAEENGRWVHATIFKLPANSLIHVTVYEYDSQGPLRNELLGRVTGVNGGVEYIDGHPLSVANANGTTAPGHTFTVPALGINIPLVGPPAKDDNNLCAAAPCQPSSPHTTITFSFRTHGTGTFRWQCFVPCGLSFLDGNGGPMATLGYMGGFLEVVS
jgi:hypothetical protein